MRAVVRNKQTAYYALYRQMDEVLNADGERTGVYTLTYEAPVEIEMNIGWARSGRVSPEQYGLNLPYVREAYTADTDCPIAENTILWIGITPDANGEAGTVKHNYEVMRIEKALNGIIYLLREVK